MAGFQESTGQLTTQEKAALHEFSYSDGYRFLGTDLGGLGVKLELVDKQQDAAAIILPPAKAKECARWMLRTIGQQEQRLPKELPDILERLTRIKSAGAKLKRGDKKKIKDAIEVLKQ
ncbi:MAG TPA: hypothetical protein VMW23_02530 [Sedimentisphaerales bacterium]|nr:hypothetical protein [Sedimentisphaerales bacterium]